MEKALLSPTLALPVLAVLLMWVFCLFEKVMMQTDCPGLGKPTTQKNLHPHSYFLYPHFLWPWIPGPHAHLEMWDGLGVDSPATPNRAPFHSPPFLRSCWWESLILLSLSPSSPSSTSRLSRSLSWSHPTELLSLLPSESSTRLWHSLQPENRNPGCFFGAPSGWPHFAAAHRGNNFSPSGHFTFTCLIKAMTTRWGELQVHRSRNNHTNR